MKLFEPLYLKTLQWARHHRAPWFLAGLSFAESSFFPVPPDVMLAPMCLAKQKMAWRYAFITTLMSVIGGLFGYLIGYLAFDFIEPWLKDLGYWDRFQMASQWFNEWGIWVILIAGFSPIPYKLFTIAAGVAGMAILPFILMSIIGRGLRFFLVAGFMVLGGEGMEQKLQHYIERIGWVVVFVVIIAYLLVKL